MESLLGQSLFTNPGQSPSPKKRELEPEEPIEEPKSPDPVVRGGTNRVLRPLNRRVPSLLTHHHTFLKPAKPVLEVESNTTRVLRKRRRRPLLTELFCPQKDGDLALYEQHARFVRSFFVEWSEYVDGEGPLPRRLLIVSGPPGCGKTCSVEVLSRKFGFRLIELETGPEFARDLINATSTARESTGEIPSRLEKGEEYTRHGRRPYFTDSNGNIVWDSRPACVYLESDGLAGAEANRFVREVSNAAWKAKRPMVLVVNNRFGPAAMELRQKHFTAEAVFRRPPASDLRRGILRCADANNIEIPRSSIDRVLEVCQGDIRASLTALQFNFLNSAAREQGATTAMSLFNDKKPLCDLDQFMDLELVKLYDRVFDYSLDTDVCWDMEKIKTIGEWNALVDMMRLSNDSDLYMRASLYKYRQLFKTGKLLEYKQAHNDFETTQKVREVVGQVQSNSSLEMYRGFSKVAVLLELLPLLGSMADLGRSPKQQSLEHLAQFLHALGVRSMAKVDGRVAIKPDLLFLSGTELPLEILGAFEALCGESPEIKTGKREPVKKRLDHKNWLKPTETQIQAARTLEPGVWLDFKVSDENQAKRGIGLRDLFV